MSQKPLGYRPYFSSGPCVDFFDIEYTPPPHNLLYRSHRCTASLDFITSLQETLKDFLHIPKDYHVFFWPGSTSGAMLACLHNLLEPKRRIRMLTWDVFSRLWAHHVQSVMQHHNTIVTNNVREFSPHKDEDAVWTLCGTTSSWVMNWEYAYNALGSSGEGLRICDGGSAVLCMPIPWDMLDAVAFSLQKGFAQPGGTGVIVLSPKAYERLKKRPDYYPSGRITSFYDTQNIQPLLFQGHTPNTPNMLALWNLSCSLSYMKKKGGLPWALDRIQRHADHIEKWIQETSWTYAISDAAWRSKALCILQHPLYDKDPTFYTNVAQSLEKQHIAYDILNHPKDIKALRIWCGPTIRDEDLSCLLHHLRTINF